jgi:hypothetical protein
LGALAQDAFKTSRSVSSSLDSVFCKQESKINFVVVVEKTIIVDQQGTRMANFPTRTDYSLFNVGFLLGQPHVVQKEHN